MKHLGALDFAGGLPVELNSGVAGLAVALVLRAPRDFARREERPDNIPLVVVGVGLLWFGWFGFNSGSALTDQGTAAAALMVYADVPGEEAERAYDFQTAEWLGALVSGRRMASDDEPVQQITRPLRAREGEK